MAAPPQQQKMHPSADGARASRSITPFQSSTRKLLPHRPCRPCRTFSRPGGGSKLNTLCWFAARCAAPKTMCQSSPARPSLANRRKRRLRHRERRSSRRRHHSLHRLRLSAPKRMSTTTTTWSECRPLLSLQHLEPLRSRGKSRRHPPRPRAAQKRSATVGAKSNSSGGVLPGSRLPLFLRRGPSRE